MRRLVLAGALWASSLGSDLAAQEAPQRHLSNAGVVRATATVDSVFVTRTLATGQVAPGDWASYLLARLGSGSIQDSVAIMVSVDSSHIEVAGRLRDLPPEARALLGPVANMVDSSTVVVADVTLDRTGQEVARFHLRSLVVNGFPFPEFLLGPMMMRVGAQFPELTRTGRDLYVQVPPDGVITLVPNGVRLTTTPSTPGGQEPRR